ncbi:MAG: dihydropteridine reductase [Clostridia bacterium]|nr:dihydropteridine reductase [Clostridia bacterium]
MNRNDKKFTAESIRSQYMPREAGDLEELRALDKKVKTPANVFAYIFGSISAIIMGSGMSLVMTNIADTLGISANAMPIGIVIGCIGLVLAIVNYPIYNAILNSRKKKFSKRIIELSNKIVNED